MQALGLIETEGVLAAIVSLDTMLKAADINLVDRTYVGGGLVSIAVTGDVSAVQVAVEAGASSVNILDNSLLVSQHVIPRPREDIKSIIKSKEIFIDEVLLDDSSEEAKEIKEEVKKEEKPEIPEIKKVEIKDIKDNKKVDLKKLKNKDNIDDMVNKYDIKVIMEALREFKVVELRKLARKYENFGLKGREISTADKKSLLTEFKKYYSEKKQDK